jgi:hypothetical protein
LCSRPRPRDFLGFFVLILLVVIMVCCIHRYTYCKQLQNKSLHFCCLFA